MKAPLTIFSLCVTLNASAATSFDAVTFGSLANVHNQTSASGPSPDHSFQLRQVNGPNVSVTTYQTPGGQNIGGNSALYSSLPDLQADYPSGTYTASIFFRRPGSPIPQTYMVQGDPTLRSIVPPVPAALNGTFVDGVLQAGETSLTISVSPWADRPSTSLVYYSLLGPAGGSAQLFQNQPPPAISFSGLTPNTTYSLEIMFMGVEQAHVAPAGTTNFAYFNNGGSSITRLTFQTVPEPTSYALLAAGAFVIFRLRRSKA